MLLNNTQKKQRLVSAMMEYIKEQAQSLPEIGKFIPVFVTCKYPGTDYEGAMSLHSDECDSNVRSIRTHMREQDSDKVVSHYMFEGTKQEMIDWLADPAHNETLLKSYEQLKKAVDRF